MEVVIIIIIAVVCVAAIAGVLIIYFTKGPPETPVANPLLYGIHLSSPRRSWVDPYSAPIVTLLSPKRSKREPDTYELIPVYRKNARKRRSSPRASRRR